MAKFVGILIVCHAIFQLIQGLYLDSPYKELLDCDESESCSSFVDEYMVKIIHRFKDSSEKPCSNFHDYALGTYFSSEPDENNFDFVERVHDLKLEEFIKRSGPNDKDKSDIQVLLFKLKFYYDQCEQSKSIDTPVSILDELPAMPTLTWPDWKKALNEPEWQTNFPWINYIAELRRFGLNRVFFEEHVAIAYNDSTRYVVELKIPEENRHDELQHGFVNLLKTFNLTETRVYKENQLVSRIEELEQLAGNVRSMHRAKHGQREPKQLLTLGELKVKVPKIDWQSYFNALLQQTNVTAELPIQISNVNYFRDIGTLIDQTDDKALAFYILFRFIYHGLDLVPRQHLGSCAEQLSLRFPLGANYIYDRFIYTTRSRDEADLGKIFSALKGRLSGHVADFLYQKLTEMTWQIGILPQAKTAAYYNYFYNDANVFNSNFIRNQWEITRFHIEQQHAKLLKHKSHMETEAHIEPEDSPYEQRAMPYFIKSRNRIIIPLEFMRPPFFTHGKNEVFRHSITAFSLAHELVRAFDPQGIIFDARGNENEIGVGILNSSQYQEILKCFQGDGEQFVEERFVDVGAFQLVVDTYFSNLATTGKNASITIETLKNSEVTYKVRKLFFLNFAQYFGGHLNNLYSYENSSKKQEFSDRLNMIVSNVPDFAKVFNCTVGTFENPQKKCQVW